MLATLIAALVAVPSPAAKSSARCSSEDDPFGGVPATITDPFDPSVLASYAVLRRAATAADRPPAINSLAEQLGFALGRYNPTNLRQLTQRPGGRRFFVVPGFPVHVEIPPARCLPRKLRPQRPKLVEQQLRREREPIACLVTTSPSGRRNGRFGGVGCPRFRDVTTYERLASNTVEALEHAGILPDGIAGVRAHFRDAPPVHVPVVENFYLYKVVRERRKILLGQLRRADRRRYASPRPRTRAQRRKLERRFAALNRRAVRELSPTHVELLAADGRVVKDVKRPMNFFLSFTNSVAIAAGREFEDFCGQNPGAC